MKTLFFRSPRCKRGLDRLVLWNMQKITFTEVLEIMEVRKDLLKLVSWNEKATSCKLAAARGEKKENSIERKKRINEVRYLFGYRYNSSIV